MVTLTEIPCQEDGLRSRCPFPKDQTVVGSPLNSEGPVAQCEVLKGPFRLLQLCQTLGKPLVSEVTTEIESGTEIYKEKIQIKDITDPSFISLPSTNQSSDSCSAQFTKEDHSYSAFSVSFASQKKVLFESYFAQKIRLMSHRCRNTHKTLFNKFIVLTHKR